MSRENDEWITHELKEVTFFIILGLIMAILVPLFFGFVMQGFEETFVEGRALKFGDILVTYIIYYIMIVVGLIGLPILKIREMLLTKRGENVARQKNPSILNVALLHDPEQDGALYNLFAYFKLQKYMRWSLSIPRMFVIAILIFGAFGMVQTLNPNAQVVGIPQTAFQMTPTTQVFFTSEPASFAETTMMLFILSILMGFNGYLVSKFKLPIIAFWIIALIIIAPLTGLGWMSYHKIVYGNSEAKLFATFIFGWMGATLTILFGTFILWYVWHFSNNFFVGLRKVVSAREDILFIAGLVLALIFISWMFIELVRKKYGSKHKKLIEAEPTF
jgi:MFS family permease